MDISSLTPRERRDWGGQVSELLAPCPEAPVSIAQCIQEKRPCKACLPAAQFLLKQVQAGRPKKEREEAYSKRFDPKKVRTLDIDGSPTLGPPDAPVTIVEWADFECPACRALYPELDAMMKRFPGQVRLIYKFYPLGSHPHGEIAARAGFAAFQQDKFWEMHHVLFDNQDRLEQPDLEGYAKQVKLDLAKFRKDMGSEDASTRIERDKKQAEGVGLQGTPTVYINGREVDFESFGLDVRGGLEEWIKLDLELAGFKPAPPPAESAAPGAGSAAPAAGSAAPAAGTAAPSASAAPSAGPPKK